MALLQAERSEARQSGFSKLYRLPWRNCARLADLRVVFTALAFFADGFSPAFAADLIARGNQPQMHFAPPALPSADEPVVLEADQISYERESRLVIADGHVSVTQGDYVLLADTLAYDQEENIVLARGHVSVLEPTGNVYFAEQVELADAMKTGVIAQFKARLSDNSLFAANEAIRKSEDVTELHEAVYSPCAILCDDGTPKDPLWQIRANKVVVDQEEQTARYRDAKFDLWGTPVFYTPYLSHPLPGAPNESGLLSPQYRRDNNLGLIVKVPVYLVLEQDKDITITPMITSKEGTVLIGQYRQMFDRGEMQFDGSITRPNDRDALGNPASGNTTRGHLFADGEFQEGDNWGWGFNIRRTTDDTYLRRYDFNYDPLLTSRLYGEGFNFTGGNSRSYLLTQALAFQGMQQQDDPKRSPLVLPAMDMFYQTAPMALHSRLSLSGGIRALTRDLGADSQRFSMLGRWDVPYITSGGHIFEFATQLRADGYHIDDFMLANGKIFDGEESRVIPQASLGWRYPLVNRFSDSTLVIEPTANFIVSPSSGNPLRIPNEDSAVPEFTDTNLFSDNRFAGYDRVETGPRINYGLRGEMQFSGNKYLTGLIGQAYRTNDDPLFPISSDLRSRFSDYVGKLGFSYSPLDLVYRFRLDKDDFSPERNEVEAGLSFRRFGVGATYLDIHNDPIVADKKEVAASVSLRLTSQWTLVTGAHRDLLRGDFTTANGGLTYQNECLTLATQLRRDFTADRDYRPSTSILFQVLFKNLN